ncbi:hypothetical protein PG988_013987 [Apiospora saccharicola]
MEGTSFFSLPREIRDQIYELCLVSTATLQPLERSQRGLAVHLLRASTAVHAEACAVLYGQNRFEFVDPVRARTLDASLARIGAAAAAHLRHVLIPFPRLASVGPGPGATTLNPNDVALAASLRRRCPRLRTLSTEYLSTFVMLGSEVARLEPPLRREVLALLDAHFRSVGPSLRRIIVRLHEEDVFHLGAGRTEEIESRGWAVCTDDDDDDVRPGDGRRVAQQFTTHTQ